MTDRDRTSDRRRSQPDSAVQRQIDADTEENRRQAERLEATTPSDVDKQTVEEIAEQAEQRAKP